MSHFAILHFSSSDRGLTDFAQFQSPPKVFILCFFSHYVLGQFFAQKSGQVLDFIGFFPPSPCWKLPMGTRRWGGEMADVWSVEYVELSKIRPLLDKHAAATNDRPVTTSN